MRVEFIRRRRRVIGTEWFPIAGGCIWPGRKERGHAIVFHGGRRFVSVRRHRCIEILTRADVRIRYFVRVYAVAFASY
jgi:hypothetical protein